MKKIFIIMLLTMFLTGCAVTFKKHTGIIKCDIAIMMAKLKSQKGNSAFEIGKYLDKCYEELERIEREKREKK
jgi:hypothetical protein